MSGSVFFALIVAVIGIVCAIFITPILLIPALLLVLIGVFAGSFFTGEAARARGTEPSGVPTTADATYDPVAQPSDTQQAV